MKFIIYELLHRFRPGDTSAVPVAAWLVVAALVVLLSASTTNIGLTLPSGPATAKAGNSGNSDEVFGSTKSGVNFGNVVIGKTGTAEVTVTNYSKTALTLTSYQISGTPFSVTGLNLPVTLGSDQTLTFTADFTPKSTGTFSGSVTLDSSKSENFSQPLVGTGVASTLTLSLSPTSLNFGNVTLGEDAQLPVMITNTGTGTVTISSATVSGTGFTISNLSLPVTLLPTQNTSFTVTFTPPGTGTFNGTASLLSNASTSPNIESLSGVGVTSSSHYVSLTWNASTSQGVLNYDVYRGTASGGPYSEIATVSGATTAYTDNLVSAGYTYYYVVTTVTGNGQSGYSNQAVATIP
jgi:Abnormal spindle-like microcephaly-assoc'd, ASPM-SPD-2-Hydin